MYFLVRDLLKGNSALSLADGISLLPQCAGDHNYIHVACAI